MPRRAADPDGELRPELALLARAACARLARELGVVAAAARDQRSTPPAASSREIAATRCGQVSQNCVGNGAPSSSNGRLLGDGGPAERAAHGDAPERARRAAELPLDDRGGRPSGRGLATRSRLSASPGGDARTMKSCSPGFTSPSRRASRTSAWPVLDASRSASSSWCCCAASCATSACRRSERRPRVQVACGAASSRETATSTIAAEREQPGRAQHACEATFARPVAAALLPSA